jgi:hypothetical protein
MRGAAERGEEVCHKASLFEVCEGYQASLFEVCEAEMRVSSSVSRLQSSPYQNCAWKIGALKPRVAGELPSGEEGWTTAGNFGSAESKSYWASTTSVTGPSTIDAIAPNMSAKG